MSDSLATLSQLLDNKFTETWHDIFPEAADNILNSTVVWALLKMKGCLKPQTGSKRIERTIRYKVGPTPIAVGKGDTLPTGEIETRTAAFWSFERAIATHIQRSQFDDVDNAGPYKIVDYVAHRTEEAMDGLKQKYEGDLLRAHVTDESGKEMQGLGDLVPPPATRSTGTYGGITRCSAFTTNAAKGITTSDYPDFTTATNPWWTPLYKQFTDPVEVNLVTDMMNAFNVVTNQQEKPDIILTSQALYELYESFGLDATMFINNQKLLDLGFENIRWKGADLTYAQNMGSTGTTIYDGGTAAYAGLTHAMLFLTSTHIDAVYNPLMWFNMSEWKPIYNQTERLAHVLCRITLVCDQLRRNLLMYKT